MFYSVRVATFCSLIALSASLNAASEFDEYMSSQEQGYIVPDQNFDHYMGETDEEFEKYKKELLTAFEEYRRSVAAVWGEADAKTPEKNNWVEYNHDRTERSVVDFDKGTVTVEVALDPQEAGNDESIGKKLQKNIIKTLILPPDERTIIEIAKEPERAVQRGEKMAEPVLADQVAAPGGGTLAVGQIKTFAKELASNGVEKRKVTGSDGKPRVVASTTFPLVPDHIRKRAVKFSAEVATYAGRSKMPKELLYAVMETESFFNPTAKSNVPAFGLMQLVPTSGARDAYKYLYKKDKVVSDHYLYVPKNNIELGSAYLQRIFTGYLSGIEDPVARTWCTIAAYNTGAGNVFRSFIGKYRKGSYGSYSNYRSKAYAKINSMSADEVYSFLKRNLPYQETRSYIAKVRERMPKYRSL